MTALATGVLGPDGRVACTGHAADPERLPGARAVNVIAEVDQDALRVISDLAAGGRIHVSITRTFGLDEIDDAFAALRQGALGKLAIRI